MGNPLNKKILTVNLVNPIFGTGQYRLLLASGTFIAPAKLLRVSVVGGGGGGASGNTNNTIIHGGTGGGFCQKIISCGIGARFTVTVGAGGAADNDGGTSTFDTMIATGGLKGAVSAAGGPDANILGGYAINGDINFSGGTGLACTGFNAGAYRATGGTSAGSPFGNGYSGGTVSANDAFAYWTGGGGVGGAGGNRTTNAGAVARTGGGGSCGAPADNVATGGADVAGTLASGASAAMPSGYILLNPIWPLIGGGGGSGAGTFNGFHGGGGAGGDVGNSGGAGGVLAGGGAGATGGAGGWGGGGGGGPAGGAGGQGFILVEW